MIHRGKLYEFHPIGTWQHCDLHWKKGGDCLGCSHYDNFVDACFKIAVATNCVGGHWEELK